MAHPIPGSRFNEDNYHVYSINEDELILNGGGDFYSDADIEPDEETWATARGLAEKYGMVIDGARGEWYGWSEYTPDPGDVSIFRWHRADVAGPT